MIVTSVLVILGTLAMTLAVVGMVRFPDTFARIHSASKAVVLGGVSVLAATVGTGDGELIARAVLVGAVALFTSPVSSHALARREHRARLDREA